MSIDKSNGINCHLVYGLYEGVNVPAFQRYLLDSVDILSYWNHLPLIYLVKTRLTPHELTTKLIPFFNNKLFIVAEINVENVGGWLPAPAWEWFRSPAPLQKSAPQTRTLFGGLLATPKT